MEVDLSLDELADILGEELALPRIQSKGKKNLTTPKVKYTGVRTTGPESLRHFKRTYKQVLKRSIAAGTYNLGDEQKEIVHIESFWILAALRGALEQGTLRQGVRRVRRPARPPRLGPQARARAAEDLIDRLDRSWLQCRDSRYPGVLLLQRAHLGTDAIQWLQDQVSK